MHIIIWFLVFDDCNDGLEVVALIFLIRFK